MAGSVAVATKQAIVTGFTAKLAALSAYDDVLVSYAWPAGKKQREKVFGARTRTTHTPASLRPGRTFRDEVGEIDFVILVESVGGSAEDADERASAIGQQFEEYIADKRNSLGVTGLNWMTVARTELVNAFNDRGHLTELTITVAYNARLT